jgi:acetyltransferase-like isoleucine patch superfamily enzyme
MKKYKYLGQNKYQRNRYYFLRSLWRVLTGFIFWDTYFSDRGITIGESVAIAPGVKIISRNHNIYDVWEYAEVKPIIIEDFCWLGANSVILPGVHLGKHTIVGAGAVVTKSFPEGYCIIGGVPAKILKRLDKLKCKENVL